MERRTIGRISKIEEDVSAAREIRVKTFKQFMRAAANSCSASRNRGRRNSLVGPTKSRRASEPGVGAGFAAVRD
jgi:hypothetical protein